MNQKTNTQKNLQADLVAKDFMVSAVIVSLLVNLAVFTTWLTAALA